jgi:hypothetical protein
MKLLLENWRRYLNEVTFSDAKETLNSKRTLKIIKNYLYDKKQENPDFLEVEFETQHRNFKNYLLDIVPEDLTDNQKGTSVLWLLKMAREDSDLAAHLINGRSIVGPRSNLETFFHHQRFMPNQDLMQMKSLDDLVVMTHNAKEEIHKAQERKNYLDAEEGTEVLSGKMERNEETGKLERTPGKSGWFIAAIHNKGAACTLGKGTDWCTATDLDYFENYYKPDDPLFFFEGFWTDPSTRFQFHYGTSQFMNAKDDRVDKEIFEKLHDKLIETKAWDKYEKLRIFDLKRMVTMRLVDKSPGMRALIDEMREILNSLEDPYGMANTLAEMATMDHFHIPTYVLRWLASEEFYKYLGVARRIVKYHDVVPSSILEDIAENYPNERTRVMAREVLNKRRSDSDAGNRKT